MSSRSKLESSDFKPDPATGRRVAGSLGGAPSACYSPSFGSPLATGGWMGVLAIVRVPSTRGWDEETGADVLPALAGRPPTGAVAWPKR